MKTKVVVIPNMINESTTGQISNLNNNQIKYHVGVVLKIVGEGSKIREIEELIKKYNLETSVILTERLNI